MNVANASDDLRDPSTLFFQYDKIRRSIIASYWLVLFLALPLWWKTTSIERLPLPSSHVYAQQDRELRFPVSIALDSAFESVSSSVENELWKVMQESQSRYGPPLDIDVFVGKEGVDRDDVYHIIPGKREDVVLNGRNLEFPEGLSTPTTLARTLSSLLMPYTAKQEHRVAQYSPRFRLAFTLLNEDASAGQTITGWDILGAINRHISPITSAVSVLHNFTIESQVQFHAPLAFETQSLEDDTHGLTPEDLTIFINSAEWTLSSSSTNDPVLHFVLFVPSAKRRPLLILNDDGTPSTSNAFLIPQWGGIVICNLPTTSDEKWLSEADLKTPFSAFSSQLSTLLGILKLPSGIKTAPSSTVLSLSSWQIDALLRQRMHETVRRTKDTLLSTVKLVQQIPNMPVDEKVQNDVQDSLRALDQIWDLEDGKGNGGGDRKGEGRSFNLTEKLGSSAQALTFSQRAFFHPGMLALLYFPVEHKYAVYTPLFANPRRSSYSGYDSYKPAIQDDYRSSVYHPYTDYRHQGGPYDRYREPPEQSKSTYEDSDKYHYNSKRLVPSPNLSTASVNRDRDGGRGRRTSVSMITTRTFEPNDSWKQINGHDEHAFYASAPANYDTNGHHRRDSREQDSSSMKSSRPTNHMDRHYRPSVSTTRDTRPIDSRDRYESYRPGYSDDEWERGRGRDQVTDDLSADRYKPYYSPSSRNGRRSPSRGRSQSRSSRQLRSRTRSRSPYSSRSRSWSSRSRSRSRSSPKRSRLPQRTSGNDRSTYNGRTSSDTWTRGRRDGYDGYSSASRSQRSTSPRRRRGTSPSRSRSRDSRSRSVSRDSIASSRASSAQPMATVQDEENSTIDLPPTLDSGSADASKTTTEPPDPISSGTLLEPKGGLPGQPDSDPALPAVPVTGASDDKGTVDSSIPAAPEGGFETISAAPQGKEQDSSSPAIIPTEATSTNGSGDQLEVNHLPADSDTSEDAQTRSSPPISQRPTAVHAPTIPDLRPEDIPKMTDAKDIRGALRVVVMTRLLAERRTRQQIVEPVLVTNLNLPPGPFPESESGTSPEVLLDEMTSPENEATQRRSEKFGQIRGGLVERFEARQVALKDKVQRLTEEYLDLHERWTAHCAVLDEQAKSKANVLFPAVGPAPVPPPPPVTGRTTRRSAASLGDAVRSDFEMEQIIASLGYDEATDPSQLSCRNVAKIPEMISVVKGKVDHVYDDNNLLVEDPVLYYAPQTGINDWTEEEKQIFLDKFLAYPKQFGAIAKFLPNKTTAQCVDYYYLHKKLINIKEIVANNAPGRKGRRGKGGKRKGNALLTDIIQHDAEVHSHPSHGSAGVAAPRARGKRGAAIGIEPRKPSSRRPSSIAYVDSNPTTATPTPEPEARPRRTRTVLNHNRYSYGTPDLDEDADETDDRPTKRAKRSRKVKSAATVDDDDVEDSPPPVSVNDKIDSATRKPSSTSDWSDEDKELFLRLLGQHGDDFKKIAASMSSKTTSQIKSYYHANKDELDLEELVADAQKLAESPHESQRSSKAVDNSASTSADQTPPMASLSQPSRTAESNTGPTREQTNGATYPAHVEMFSPYPDAHRYPRYPTSVTSPYGAMAMPTMYAPGVMGGIPPGTYSPAGYGPSTNTPQAGAVPGYPANPYGASGTHYMPYTYPYQQGTAYPPYPPSASPVPPSTVTPYVHSIPDPNAMSRPYYHYS
ncbi:hypothetical protein D9758_002882 [Tetrapyrgos nigripes]|uniref:SANT domain-containing protein n=1 Tax=Tetrapyrgos nigripes TaxID=182062 RepID=A0A8H5GQJ7_9AGAR|nr:hypothetical protein D9758_002882 [Tetrapyrgos nigripes]